MTRKDVRKDANIVLTGFMGTGKTTVGRRLATHFNYDFVDTDVLIEQRAGMTIPAIFAEQGEAAFRALERATAADLATRQRTVIATGGGLLLDAANADVLGRTGHIFCLTATPDEILARVLADEKAMERPLLKVADPAQRIRDLLADRHDRYGRFTQIVTSGRNPAEVVQLILDQLAA